MFLSDLDGPTSRHAVYQVARPEQLHEGTVFSEEQQPSRVQVRECRREMTESKRQILKGFGYLGHLLEDIYVGMHCMYVAMCDVRCNAYVGN